MVSARNSFLWGFIPSLLLPPIFMVIFILSRYPGELEMFQLIKELMRVGKLSGLLAMGAFPNLFLFLYSMHKENWMLGRGVIAATMFYGVAVMVMKVV